MNANRVLSGKSLFGTLSLAKAQHAEVISVRKMNQLWHVEVKDAPRTVNASPSLVRIIR